ncbi:MAG: DMT family transporter [Ilumatobacteraceae bacterium]|jgi:drug/metabolite transporter (DMT)-like permease|nr:DMT family transporter [Ilumatobacteraceae bacterium]
MGIIFILISGAAFGLLPWFARTAYDHGTEPLGMLAVRFTFASILLLAVHSFRKKDISLPSKKLSIQLFLLGAVGYAPQATFFFFGVERIDTSLATVIFYTYPAFVVLASWVVFRHTPSVRMAVCLIVAVLGTALTAGQISTGSGLGVALMFGASTWYTGYILISSKITGQSGAFVSLTYVMVGAAVSHLLLLALLRPSLPQDTTGWLAVFAAAIISTVVAMGFFFAGVSRIGPGEAAVFSTIEPVVSIAVGVYALDENLTTTRIIGALCVLVSVAVLAQLSRADTK